MNHRLEIDGLRAIAVLPVILFHAGFSIFSGGFVGVDIFFVISGYLITCLVVDEMDKGSFALADFYERRARRILPALFFMMLCTLPFAWLWMLPLDLKGYSLSLFAVPLFSSNIAFYMDLGYFDTANELKPLLHTWSLSVEEQYYLLYPIFLLATWKFGKNRAPFALSLVVIASLLFAQWCSTPHASFSFYMLPTRSFEIALGALVSMIGFRNKYFETVHEAVGQSASLIGLALILFAVFSFDKSTPSPSFYTLIPIIGASLVLMFSNTRNAVGELLGSKPFVGIGLISYSAYLWHQPLFAFAKLRTLADLSTPFLLALSASSFGIGYLSWKYVESPFRNKDTVSRRNLLIFGSSVSLIFIVIGSIGFINDGFPNRVSDRIVALTSNPQAPMSNALCQSKYPQFSIFNSCLLSKNKSPDVLIVGDSHSQHYFKSAATALKTKTVMNLSAFNCLPFSTKSLTSLHHCNDKIDTALQFITQTDSIRVVILSGYWSYLASGSFGTNNQNYRQPSIPTHSQRDTFIQTGNSVLDAITRSGKRVFLMMDIPGLNFNIQSCFDMKPYKINQIRTNCSMAYSDYRLQYGLTGDLLKDLLTQYPTIEVYDPRPLFCSNEGNVCRATINGQPLYFNSDHLTVAGSNLVIRDLLESHPIR